MKRSECWFAVGLHIELNRQAHLSSTFPNQGIPVAHGNVPNNWLG